MDKKVFAHTVLGYKEGRVSEDEFVKQLYELGRLVFRANRFNVDLEEDFIHDAILKIWRLKAWQRVNPQRSSTIWSYFWGAFYHTMLTSWKRATKEYSIDYQDYLSNLERELTPVQLQQLQEEGVSMLDHAMENAIQSRRSTPKRYSVAKYWYKVYEIIKQKKTVHEDRLIDQLPPDKRAALKDPRRMMYLSIRKIAKQEGDMVQYRKGTYYFSG